MISDIGAWAPRLRIGLAAAALCLGPAARAENHALILWIGEYADPRANLPGIDKDAAAARVIMHNMGVADRNITELKNQQLNWAGLSKAFAGLTSRIHDGDKVILYYSGHGAQRTNSGAGKKCSEGMVAQDVQLYFDRDLENDLQRLGAKASQVVMFNDSCFSGGAASTKGWDPSSRLVPKFFPTPVGAGKGAASAAGGAAYQCGEAVNKGFMTKNFEVVARQGANLLYLAAARDDEVSYASPDGSIATQAWAVCLANPATDTDHSGSISGSELQACAQATIDRNKLGVTQHVSNTGNLALPVAAVLAAPHAPAANLSASAAAAVAAASAANAAVAATAVNAPRALADIRAGADKALPVALKPARRSVHIAQDYLEFSVTTKTEGYLYILQVGSDGTTFNLLFPNKVDADNHLPAGTHAFPRTSWRLRSAGPAGTDHLMAILSSTPKDFSQQMSAAGPFSTAPATAGAAKTLVVVATGAATGANGRYGASDVITIEEAP